MISCVVAALVGPAVLPLLHRSAPPSKLAWLCAR
jgi:hypothetical protein